MKLAKRKIILLQKFPNMQFVSSREIFVHNHYLINLLSAQEAPPLIPALTSGRYHIKWTQLTDPPVPLHNVFVAVQHHKIYVTGSSSAEDAKQEVYVYDINYNHWGQLPPSGHYYGIPHIIGGRLAIIGGRLLATKKRTNKVSTFSEDKQTWTSYYPNLLSVRSRPGVVSHLKHVIVAGGARATAEDDDTRVAQDDIEILNWVENSHWRKVSMKIPEPMLGFTPAISDGDLIIVGYSDVDVQRDKRAYKIPVADVIASIDQSYNAHTPSKWTELTSTDHFYTAIVPSSSPPVVAGGRAHILDGGAPTADIKMYDNSNKSWKKIGSLSSARSRVAIATVYNNAIIVVGGSNAESFDLTVVELGQAELLH